MTGLTKERVARCFSRSFHSYHDAASQQARIAHRLAEDLAGHATPGRFGHALEIGCGTGHLTRALQSRFRFARLTLNDLMPEAAATARAAGAGFLLGDACEVAWPDAPDLIASASVIQWLDRPGALVRRAAAALAPGGWLALSGFGPQQYRELAALGSAARAPGLCEPQMLHHAARCGAAFDLLEAAEDVRQLWFESPVQLLHHLRRTGVNAGASGIWSRTRLRQFCDAYSDRFGEDRGVPLTYHAVRIIGCKRA